METTKQPVKNLVMETLQKITKYQEFSILINFNKKSYKIQDYVISIAIKLF